MDQQIRNILQTATQRARRLLEIDIAEQLGGTFDILEDGTVADEPGPHLSPEQRLVRLKLVESVRHRAGGSTQKARLAEAVSDHMREAAFTVLNRFVALKMLEARGLLQQCISKGDQSSGFKEFCLLAAGLAALPDKGYRLYLECIFDELSVEVKILFDRHDPASLIWPKRQAFDELLAILNDADLESVWAVDETIGWVYQYFNSQADRDNARYDERGKPKAPGNTYELAVRNQFFTPRYIVQFLTDNTLGRVWYEMRKGQTQLAERCAYLVRRPTEIFLNEGETASDTPKDQPGLSRKELLKQPVYLPYRAKKDPRDLKILDPASGSGHFLLYGFDLLLTIYEEAWNDSDSPPSQITSKSLREDYPNVAALREAVPGLILRHNLHGIDIDARCAQIAGLALWMRAQRAFTDFGFARDKRPLIRKTNIVVAEPMPGEQDLFCEFLAGLREDRLDGLLCRTLHLPEDKHVRATKAMADSLCELVRVVWDKMRLAGETGSLLKIEDEIATAVARGRSEWEKELPLFRVTEYDLAGEAKVQDRHEVPIEGNNFWNKAETLVISALREFAQKATNGSAFRRKLFADDAERGFAFLDLFRERYDVVLMNPPFGDASLPSKPYLDETYGDTRGDVYKAFVECFQSRLVPTGYLGIISSRTGFFLGQSEDWRTRVVLRLFRPIVLCDLGGDVLDAMVEVAAYVLRTLSAHEARDLTLSLVPVLNKVSLDRQKRFSFPKWQAARGGLKRHQAAAELEHLETAGFVQRSPGEIIRYMPMGDAIRRADAPSKLVYPLLVCIRTLTDQNKGAALLEASRNPENPRNFVSDPGAFNDIPGSPFAYWAGINFRRLFSKLPTFEANGRIVRAGGQTSDDFRYLRAFWECAARPTVGSWRTYVKGGAYSPFYNDLPLLAQWHDERNTFPGFLGRPGRSSEQPSNYQRYFQPGITWPLRAKAFSPQVMPGGCIFTVRGYAILAPVSQLLPLLGLSASSIFDYMFKMLLGRFGYPEFVVGVLQKLPTPNLANEIGKSLGQLAYRGWAEKRKLKSCECTSHPFLVPSALAVPGKTLSERTAAWDARVRSCAETIASIQIDIEDLALHLYGLDATDRAALNATLATESSGGTELEAEEIEEEETGSVDARSLTTDLLAYTVGAIVGRWDIRFALGEKQSSHLPDPFAPLAICQPGQLQNEQGLPLTKSDFRRLQAAGLWAYPLDVAWDGILVDDPGHPMDIESRIHGVLQLIFTNQGNTIAQEASGILGESTLREYLRKPGGFFDTHLRRYSKSGRRAPIYWELATPSHNYAVWLYYHRFTKDTFYQLLNEYVKPKLEFETTKLSQLRADAGAEATRSQREEIEEQVTFVEELERFREGIKQVAPLWEPDLNDGVMINFAPLWRLVPQHKSWQKELKACWDKFVAGDYDWSHLAMHLWPERVVAKCQTNRSLAIAHGLEDVFWEDTQPDADVKAETETEAETQTDEDSDMYGEEEEARPKKQAKRPRGKDRWVPKSVDKKQIENLIAERTNPTVKAALTSLLEAPTPGGKITRNTAIKVSNRTKKAPSEGLF